ncbi:hypothetical protein B0T16DRAFT_396533 [Cercophora newfieldiana]|uniref:Restriction endonuclease domain-containing protein n=1 Tax=Cercophora newfieldiana TaxID=92897 RepID=A0AA40CYK0_9PEZI|nr:hypothetical protein B0T16DRAFT_396533 [Cercophora newfieldiana]
MENHRDDDEPDALAPGSFQDLMELLEELDHDSPREPFAGMAFFVSPAQYLTILQMELPSPPGPSDYSGNILYYKSTTSWIHRSLVLFFARTLNHHIAGWMKNCTLKEFLDTAFVFPTEVADANNPPTFYLIPDVALLLGEPGQDLSSSPPLVVEVMYAHQFSCEQAEERYKQYFRAKDGGVKVLICLRLHYARGIDRAKKTAEKLDRSSVGMWMMDKDGNVQTVLR